jgi:diguanylate cyclase (GGDEF)-like protein/PAS domain S-box-containing protein
MNSNTRTYFISIIIALTIVEFFFFLQVTFVLKEFKIQYAVVPTLLATTIGFLIGKVLNLKRKLASKEKIFHTIANEAKEFSYFKKNDGTYEYVSPACLELTGYSQEEFYSTKNFFDEIILKQHKNIWDEHLKSSEDAHFSHEDIEVQIIHKNGNSIWINHNCSAVFEDGEKVGVRSVNSDITKRKEDEKAIISLSLYDTLTKLPNRKYIFKKLSELKEQDTRFAVVFMDLNRFKKINDSLGHSVGDLVLQQVAKNFKECDTHNAFVGRLGGDEFIIIFEKIISKDKLQPFVDKLYKTIAKEYTINDYTFYIGTSMGVSFFPYDSDNIYDILACADKAMYKAKEVSSSENIVYYNESVKTSEFDDFLIEKELREAIQNNTLEVYLQPKFNTDLNCREGNEALIRWKNHNNTFISPTVFIPVAEETGLIREITLYVINEVFAFVHKKKELDNSCVISINLSMIDLMSDSFVKEVSKKLEFYQLDANLFEFELTESIFLEESSRIKDNIQLLIDLGFKIALDDFGTGYSSLSYLTKLPINTLKVDKTFIDNLHINYEKNFPLLKSIVTLANDLQLNIIIEGVETEEQLRMLHKLGSFVIQGYYFYKPMSFSEISSLEAS